MDVAGGDSGNEVDADDTVH